MLFRLVRPVKRQNSTMSQFVQRIPKDLRGRALGRSLSIPIGADTVQLTISPQAEAVRFSLRTREPSETKRRQAEAAVYLETVWQALREDFPIPLTHRQATALADRLYRAWASGEGRERTTSVTIDRLSGEWKPDHASADDVPDFWESARRHLDRIEQTDDEFQEEADRTSYYNQKAGKSARPLERAFGPIIDRLLLSEGIWRVDLASRKLSDDVLKLRDHPACEASRDHPPLSRPPPPAGQAIDRGDAPVPRGKDGEGRAGRLTKKPPQKGGCIKSKRRFGGRVRGPTPPAR